MSAPSIGGDVLALARAAAARLWLRLGDEGHVPPPAPSLREALGARGREAGSLTEAIVRRWSRDPATSLGRVFELVDGDPEALALLALAVAPLLDAAVARTYDALAPRGTTGLTLGLLLDLAADGEAERLALASRLGGAAPLLARGLVELEPTVGLASTAPVSVPPAVIAALRGVEIAPPACVQAAVAPGQPPHLALAPAGLPPSLREPILFTAASPSAAETLGRVIAGELRRTLWTCTPPDGVPQVTAWSRLLRDAALAGALVACDLLPEREPEPTVTSRRVSAAVAAARRLGGPLVLFMPTDDHIPSWAARELRVVPVLGLPVAAGGHLAEARLRQEGAADAAEIASRAIVPLAPSVAQVEPLLDVERRGLLEEDSPRARTEVGEALRPRLGNLVERVTRRAAWDSLVVPDELKRRLRDIVTYRRHADRVYRDWGLGRHVGGEGVAALFSGPPGTGKSLAASVIASELGIALFRVDLSRIVSKWIGETEKNLAQLFAESRSGRAVLLFDEADSLFGKRTDVKSSNDRYANLEVNFLLQKLDEFDGIAILTTNSPNAIDAAFMRRLQFRVHFEPPDVEARIALWMQHLPPPEQLDADVDLERLADGYEFSGGNIRNAAIRAAFLAAEEGVLVGARHLSAASITEAEELGRVVRREGR